MPIELVIKNATGLPDKHVDMTLVSEDENIRKYDVKTLWKD